MVRPGTRFLRQIDLRAGAANGVGINRLNGSWRIEAALLGARGGDHNVFEHLRAEPGAAQGCYRNRQAGSRWQKNFDFSRAVRHVCLLYWPIAS
jgi:hypothetical protein